MSEQSYDPTMEILEKAYDDQIKELISQTQAGEQAKMLLSSDLGKEVRNHIVLRQTSILREMAEIDLEDDANIKSIKALQFEYRVISTVTNIMALLITQSDNAIQQFEQLTSQRSQEL